VIQAIEFTANEWRSGKRFELALQWLNVGDGAPCWCYWDPQQTEDRWQTLPISAQLAPNKWHLLEIEGAIRSDATVYERFVINGEAHALGISVPAEPATGEQDKVAVGIQLDGNSRQDDYEVLLDQVSLDIAE
jgi:hypothetical protein